MNRFSRSSSFAPFAVFLFLALAGSTPGVAWAEPVRLFDPATISVQTLPSGVRSVVQENPGGDLVSVQVWVRAGSRFETKDNNGITHVIETLATRGSKNYPDNKGGIREAIEGVGGEVSSLSSRDSMFYGVTAAAPFLPNVLRALADATLLPDLADAKVESAKEELMSQLTGNDPTRVASNLAYGTAFPTHPYRRPPEGTLTGLAALTGAKVRAYHQARFAGENISVVIVGDVTKADGHKLVAQYFGGAPKAAPQAPIAPDKPLTTIQRQSTRGLLPVTFLTIGFRSPGIKNAADVVASDVLLACWKEGRDATLRTVLKGARPLSSQNEPAAIEEEADDESENEDENAPGEGEQPEPAPAPEAEPPVDEENRPLALAFDVEYLTQRDSGLFLISLIAPRDRNAAIRALAVEIARVKANGLTDEELARAKEILRLQYIQQSQTITGQAGALGFYEMIDSYQFATTYLDRVARVTNEDIRRVASEYLKADAHVEITVEGLRLNPPPPDKGTITARLFR